ncbi:hypothetical protein CDAR_291791 [Caerostris darwini]|uniref:Uncharacterized protein n=1 Tax=Caerostris darwini TaxID=1538125 RepID=A0AAV4NUB8_9ARAC|nr:hypothetical protein CDAR_291791 [Caerostris darwini]
MFKEEEQARINCEGLGYWAEQLENQRRLFLQLKETYQSAVKILPNDDVYSAKCSKKLQGLLTAITAYEKQNSTLRRYFISKGESGGMYRAALQFLVKGGKTVGKEALITGTKVINDILSTCNISTPVTCTASVPSVL